MNSKDILYSAGNNDECITPEYGVKPILEFLPTPWPGSSPTIWCPFDKESSNFVKLLREKGYKVIHSHIDDGQDFLTWEPEQKWDAIISNPPFSKKRSYFERAISFGKPFAMLMTNTWLNDAAPKQLFKDIGLQLLMFDKRIEYLNTGGSGKITFSSSYFCRDFLPSRLEIKFLDKQ
jgi:hypothetical protein